MYWTLGCIYGATAVGFGAFGAHGLKKVVTEPAKIASFATAAHYQVRTSDATQCTHNLLRSIFPYLVSYPLSPILFTFFSGNFVFDSFFIKG